MKNRYRRDQTRTSGYESAAGRLSMRYYDDTIAKGMQIELSGNKIVAVDVLEDTGEIRVLLYKTFNPNEEPTIFKIDVGEVEAGEDETN